MSEANETITKVAAEWQKLADYFGCKAKVSRRDAEAQSGNAAWTARQQGKAMIWAR